MEMKNESNAINGEFSVNDHIEHAKQLRSEAIAGFFRHTAMWLTGAKKRVMTTDFGKIPMPGIHKPCH